ncbi:iron complex transport system permease protein [Aeromonas sp. RU39B]|uniref:FecCD family ABC transporter permease n=1 Tax=Aeromonas sp. RU39B TaxID=1907416 RepID=UPI000953BAFC|nr:iron ABC transporter permease [Aeromonas sp. RU39B]SIQ17049.1 iron complex transport system permease protein [Aeromonas sp. RU39B]
MKFWWLAPLCLLAAVYSLTLGHYSVCVEKVGWLILNPLSPSGDEDAVARQVVLMVRLPRVLMAFGAGATLALAGAALQGVFRNPLVDPHIIGVSSGAALGGALAILFGLSSWLLLGLSLMGGITSLLCVFILGGGAQKRGGLLSLVLAGLIVSGFFSACVSLVQYLADSEETLPSIVFWLLGSFATASFAKLAILYIPLLLAGGILLVLRWRLNLLSLDDVDARALGINTGYLRWWIILLCALLVAAQVAVSGAIAWVGLVVPHLARQLGGPDHRRLLPLSAGLGGLYMLLIDDLARTLSQGEIPLGILTALIGAPLFAGVWLQRQRMMWHE